MPPYRETSERGFFKRPKIILLIVIILVIAGWGIFSRERALAHLHKDAEDQSVASVLVIKATTGPANEEVVLPGTIVAWHESPIFARTSGYLKDWKTDIGTHVKAGDVLAEIDTPEVDAQLHQAQADVATAAANNALAQSTVKRWKALLKTNSVSKQEADEKIGDAAAKAASLNASRANLDRLAQLESFKVLRAPFKGIVTARNTDNGALINIGSSGQAMELFHVADTHKLRVYVQVPETYTGTVNKDLKAELRFTEYPGKTFPATFLQTSHAIDPTTRTLQVEFVADNANDELMPGGYTEVHIKLPSDAHAVRLPVNTLIFRSGGMQAATVGSDNTATLKSITIGRDYGKEVEVVSGITPDEPVVVNPPDSLVTGQKVRIIEPKTADKAPVDDKKTDEKTENDKK